MIQQSKAEPSGWYSQLDIRHENANFVKYVITLGCFQSCLVAWHPFTEKIPKFLRVLQSWHSQA